MRAAYALKKRNKNVNVLVKSGHIFSQMLDHEAADILRKHLEANGVKITTGVEAKEICGNGAAKGVILDNNTQIPAQLIVIGKGVASNTGLVKSHANVEYGVLVDNHLLTSQPDLYAAGDVAQTHDLLEEKSQVNAIWPAAVRQGRIAGLNMAGKDAIYEGSCGMNSVDFFGLSVISFGIVRPVKPSGCEELIGAELGRNIYRKIVLKDNRIVGGIFINDVERHGIYLHLALQKIDVSEGLAKIGIKAETIKSAPLKDAFSQFKPMNEIEREYLEGLLAHTFERFKMLVRINRDIAGEEEVFSAKVFHAQEAKALGLIDGIGTIYQTRAAFLHYLKERYPNIPLDRYSWVKLLPKQSRFGNLLGALEMKTNLFPEINAVSLMLANPGPWYIWMP